METPAFLFRVCPQLDKKEVQWLWVLTPLCSHAAAELIMNEFRAAAVGDVSMKVAVTLTAHGGDFGSLFQFRGRFKHVLRTSFPTLTVTTMSRLLPARLYYEASPGLYSLFSPSPPSSYALRFSVRE